MFQFLKINLCKLYDKPSTEDEPATPSNIKKCYFIGIAYGATLGGCGTLIGTQTNLLLKGIYENNFPDSSGILFAPFMLYSTPVMLVYTFLSWVWLQFWFMGMFRPNSEDAKLANFGAEGQHTAEEVVRVKSEELGSITAHEISVAIVFVLTILLWAFRDPGSMKGWSQLFTNLGVGDATPAVIGLVIIFILPAKWTVFNFCNNDPGE